MSETGEVSRTQVVRVLKAEGSLSFSLDGDVNALTYYKDGNPEVVILTDPVPRKMLHRLAHKFGIPIEYFYHPEMAGGSKKNGAH